MIVARWLYVWRFFLVVAPVPRLLHAAIGVTTAVAGIVIALDSGRAPQALTPLLLLQLFASSSGFLLPARRGYYDLVLTSGARREVVAAAHWTAAALPGALGWGVLALIENVSATAGHVALVTPGAVAAISVVSIVPWAASLRLPRFAAAIGWLLVLSAGWMIHQGALPAFEAAGGRGSWPRMLMALVYPPMLVGSPLTGWNAAPILTAFLASAGAAAGALAWIARADIPLEAR